VIECFETAGNKGVSYLDEAAQKEWSAAAELMRDLQSRSSGTAALPWASRLHSSAIGKSQPEYDATSTSLFTTR
jgi:hypothetical protein